MSLHTFPQVEFKDAINDKLLKLINYDNYISFQSYILVHVISIIMKLKRHNNAYDSLFS